jgi:hypothetical protein
MALMDHVLVSSGGQFRDTTESTAVDVERILQRAVDTQPKRGCCCTSMVGWSASPAA